MTNTKPFWASKTLWANALSVIAAVSIGFGVDLGLDPETQTSIIIAIMGVVNVVLRFKTKMGIGL